MSRIRYGMVGGGPGAFIGAVHRTAARLDGELELVAGAFSSDPDRSAHMGRELELAPERAYGSFREMAEAEAGRPAGERIEVVSVVTPNHLHHPVARTFLEAGIHVVCDKPLATSLEDAEDLCRISAERDLLFCVTHNYTGYPMVKEARERIAAGALGTVRKVVVEYAQGWLATPVEREGQKQAEWRLDPERAGPSSAVGDIGSHAHNLMEYVTGLRIRRLAADLGTVVPGRSLEDDGTILLELAPEEADSGAVAAGPEDGARGVLLASQVSVGERNRLRLRVYGAEGGLDWCQEEPESLRLTFLDRPERILHRGGPGLSERAAAHTRLPAGHPEGFLEAFANLYRNVARSLRARTADEDAGPFAEDFPTVQDGARGVHFVLKSLESQRLGQWVDARYEPPGG